MRWTRSLPMRWSRSASLRWTAAVGKKKSTPITEMKGFKHSPRKFVGLLAPYESALATRPVLTKCVTGGVLAFLGDLVAQRVNNVQKGKLQFDERRLAAFTVFGVGWTGLFNHYWFGWLATVIPGAGVTAVVGKTIVQHGFCNPVLYLPLFYVFNGVATGLSQPQILEKAQAEYWPTLTKLWTIWVPSTALQFFLGAR
eukprot:COSAG02_NODE_596_length_19794_cov_14.707591_4_plen_198_part_00